MSTLEQAVVALLPDLDAQSFDGWVDEDLGMDEPDDDEEGSIRLELDAEDGNGKGYVFDETEHPRGRDGKFIDKGTLDLASGIGDDIKKAGAPYAGERASALVAVMGGKAAQAIRGTLRKVYVAKKGGTSWGGGQLSLDAKYADKNYTYETYDEVYRETKSYDTDYIVTHELGHAVLDSLTLEERQSWRNLTGWKNGKELETAGTKRVPVLIPEQFKKRKEFKQGQIWDWSKIGWTYEGYRRKGDYVHATEDAAGRWRIESVSTPVGGTAFLPVSAKKPPTGYGGSNSKEEFAEAFTLYHQKPEMLKIRRPDMYDWMDRWHKS